MLTIIITPFPEFESEQQRGLADHARSEKKEGEQTGKDGSRAQSLHERRHKRKDGDRPIE